MVRVVGIGMAMVLVSVRVMVKDSKLSGERHP